jgi:hypothetical protein
VENYIKRIGSITRALTPEEARELSCEAHTVEPGQTLIHLALQRHSNHNVLVVLLSHQQQVSVTDMLHVTLRLPGQILVTCSM